MGWFLGFDKIASAGFGNVTIVNLLFMFIVMTCVTETGAVVWLIKNYCLSNFFLEDPGSQLVFFFMYLT